jgi:hypothetical protein
VVAVIRSGWLTTGAKTRQFEAEFPAFLGARHAVAVNSCTAAMHLALELDYLSHRTFGSDLVLLCRTALAVFRPKSATAPTADVASTRASGSG